MKKITPQGVWSSPIETDLTSLSAENLLENLKKILERIETLKEKIVEIKGTGFSDPVTSSLADLSNLSGGNTQNLANKTLNETITGSWTFNSPTTFSTIKGPNSSSLLISGRSYGVEINIDENLTGTGAFVISKGATRQELLVLRSDSGNLGVNTMFPTEKIHVNGNIRASQFISSAPPGIAPFQVNSTIRVTNLNADLLDDYHASTSAIIETVAVRDSQGYISASGIKGSNTQNLVISGENRGVTIEIDKDLSGNDFFLVRSKNDPVIIIDSQTNNVGIFVLSPSERLEVYGNIKAEKFISTLPTGTAPLQVSSTTLVTNLNSDLLDGYHASTNANINTVAVRDGSGFLTASGLLGNNSYDLLINARNYGMELRIDENESGSSNFKITKGSNGSTTLLTLLNNGDLKVSGVISGRYNQANRFVVQTYIQQNISLGSGLAYTIAQVMVSLPPGKALYLKRVRWSFQYTSLVPKISACNGNWTGSDQAGDVEMDLAICNILNYPETIVKIELVNNTSSTQTISLGSGVWAELEIR
jgi:hypothetical protein